MNDTNTLNIKMAKTIATAILFFVVILLIINLIFLNDIVNTEKQEVDVLIIHKYIDGYEYKVLYEYDGKTIVDEISEQLYINTDIGGILKADLTKHIYVDGSVKEFVFIKNNQN